MRLRKPRCRCIQNAQKEGCRVSTGDPAPSAARPAEDGTLREASEKLLAQLEVDEQAADAIRMLVLANLAHPDLGLSYVEKADEIARRHAYPYAQAVCHAMRFYFLYATDVVRAIDENEAARRIIRAVPDYTHTPAYLSILNNAVLGSSLQHDYITAYKNAVEGLTLVDPDKNASVYCALLNNTALILADIGLHHKALRQLERSMEYLPRLTLYTRVSTQYRYADALMQAGRLNEAEALFKSLCENHTDIYPWQFYPPLMRIAYLRGDGPALDAWQVRLVKTNPYDGEKSFELRNVGFALGLWHVYHGRFEEAEKLFLDVVEDGGAAMLSQYDLLSEFALLYDRWNKPDKACIYYRMLDDMHRRALALADEVFTFEDEAGGRAAFERASASLYRRVRKLSALGQRITACLNYAGVRACLLSDLSEICPFDAMELVVREGKDGHFYPADPPDGSIRIAVTPWEQYAVVQRCISQGVPLKMADVSAQRDALPPLSGGAMPASGCMLLVPIRFQAQVLGLLYLHHPATAFYDQEHQDAAETLCSSLGIALHIIGQFQDAVLTSLTDPLTGIHNRAGLFRREADLRARCGGRAAVLLLDVDDFKQINDACGHEGGDEVLCSVGALLRDWAGIGVACRYGGDEFLVLLPGIDEDALRSRAKALCEQVHAQVPRPDGRPLSISVGAYALKPDQPLAQAISLADRLLYQAKKEGKNRACVGAET